jgi:nitrilase
VKKSVKIGIVQSGPEYLDLEKSMEKAVALVEEAAGKGAELVVFGESWFTGYPAWLDFCPEVALWDHGPTKDAFVHMYKNSVEIPGKEITVLCDLARTHEIVIVMGVNEIIKAGIGNGTIYNSLLIINEDGKIANHHRKLMPTFTEKLVYGMGDGNGLKACETRLGRIGGLICWEHWMPLARQAMHNSGEHIHIAVWPWVHDIHQLASRHYAFEARCFVVAVGQVMRVRDIPAGLQLPDDLKGKPGELILKGGSCIVAPDGSYVLGPQVLNEGVFVQEISDMDRVYRERMTLDTSGHYNRNDVFDFQVNFQKR